MFMNILGILLVTFLLVALLAVVHRLKERRAIHPELSRKLVHVGMGLVTLLFPFIFSEAWPVVFLGISSVTLLWVLRSGHWSAMRSLGKVLHSVDREGEGEIYFCVSVVIVFLFSGGDPVLYGVPVLIMSLADAVAALIGVRYGLVKYTGVDCTKSLEGSTAFFTVTFFSTHVPLLLFTSIGREETLLISLILALLVMLLEAVAWRGLDNLFVPLGAFVMLKAYATFTVFELMLRLLSLSIITGIVLFWRRHTTLNTNALVGSLLYAYASFALGGILWLIPPLFLFLSYTLLWPQVDRRENSPHDMQAVTSVVAPGLLWIFLAGILNAPEFLIPYSLAFAINMAFIGIAWARMRSDDSLRSICFITLYSWCFVALPILAVFPIELPLLTPILSLSCIIAAAACYLRWIPHDAGQSQRDFPWLRQSVISWSASLPVLVLVPVSL